MTGDEHHSVTHPYDVVDMRKFAPLVRPPFPTNSDATVYLGMFFASVKLTIREMSAGATRVGLSCRWLWRGGVRDVPAGRGHVETLVVDSRRFVRRQNFENRSHVRNRGGRL